MNITPDAPSSPSLQFDSLNHVVFKWTDGGLDHGYIVYRNGEIMDTTASDMDTYIDSTVPFDTICTYAVEAILSNGNRSALCSATVSTSFSPFSLTLEKGESYITLNWGDTSWINDGFLIERYDNKAFAVIDTVKENDSYYVDSLPGDGENIYRVRAYRSSMVSSNTTGVNGFFIARPTLLDSGIVIDTPQTSVTLVWEDNSLHEQNYVIEHAGPDTVFAFFAQLPANSTRFNFPLDSLSAEDIYHYFRITALHEKDTNWSDTVLIEAGLKDLWAFDNSRETISLVAGPDGAKVYAGNHDGEVSALDIRSGEVLWTQAGQRISMVYLALSPDGTHLAYYSDSMRVLQSEDGVVEWGVRLNEAPNSMQYSPDGRFIATGGGWQSGRVYVWDVANGELAWKSPPHLDIINELMFFPKGDHVASISSDNTVTVWDALTGIKQWTGYHEYGVNCIDISPDGSGIATGGDDRAVILWDSGKGTRRWTGEHTGAVTDLLFAKDGKVIISGCDQGTIKAWDAISGNLLWENSELTAGVSVMCISPDSKTIAVGTIHLYSIPARVYLLDSETGQITGSTEHPGDVNVMTYGKDDTILVTGGGGDHLWAWQEKWLVKMIREGL